MDCGRFSASQASHGAPLETFRIATLAFAGMAWLSCFAAARAQDTQPPPEDVSVWAGYVSGVVRDWVTCEPITGIYLQIDDPFRQDATEPGENAGRYELKLRTPSVVNITAGLDHNGDPHFAYHVKHILNYQLKAQGHNDILNLLLEPKTGSVRAAVPNDADGDGMDDTLEHSRGLDPDRQYDRCMDSDGDGYLNHIEIAGGTHPKDAASKPSASQDREALLLLIRLVLMD